MGRTIESEPRYVPYFWEMWLAGNEEKDAGDFIEFKVTRKDRQLFPELAHTKIVELYENPSGHIGHILG